MTNNEELDYLHQLEEAENYYKYNRLEFLFCDEDTSYPFIGSGLIHSRFKYPKHLKFIEATANHRECCFLAANRIGKTLLGGYIVAICATGLYPKWWNGIRFDRPIQCWCAGNTNETARDIIQYVLLGEEGDYGTGLIPKKCLTKKPTTRQGVPNARETIYVDHFDKYGNRDGYSVIGIKSYDQGFKSFMGTEKHLIWLDEEPEKKIYSECITRTMMVPGAKKGSVITTFTPLLGLSEVVLSFLPNGKIPENGVVI